MGSVPAGARGTCKQRCSSLSIVPLQIPSWGKQDSSYYDAQSPGYGRNNCWKVEVMGAAVRVNGAVVYINS